MRVCDEKHDLRILASDRVRNATQWGVYVDVQGHAREGVDYDVEHLVEQSEQSDLRAPVRRSAARLDIPSSPASPLGSGSKRSMVDTSQGTRAVAGAGQLVSSLLLLRNSGRRS